MTRQFSARVTREALRRPLMSDAAPSPSPAGQDGAGPGDPDPGPTTGTDEELVTRWLTRLHLLQGVPFNYLLPDIGMLPAESIRFFQIDNNWIAALVDGAYSIGSAGVAQTVSDQAGPVHLMRAAKRAASGAIRRAQIAQARSRTAFAAPPPQLRAGTPAPEVLSGFLLRSAVVAGWPGLQATAFADLAGADPLTLVRLECVAPSLMIGIYSGGVIARLDFQEPSEGVHFGLDPNGAAWKKDLRFANGDATTVGTFTGTDVAVTLRGTGTPPIVPIHTLAQSMATQVWTTPPPTGTAFTAAQFGLEMVEGVQKVTFQLTSTS